MLQVWRGARRNGAVLRRGPRQGAPTDNRWNITHTSNPRASRRTPVPWECHQHRPREMPGVCAQPGTPADWAAPAGGSSPLTNSEDRLVVSLSPTCRGPGFALRVLTQERRKLPPHRTCTHMPTAALAIITSSWTQPSAIDRRKGTVASTRQVATQQ